MERIKGILLASIVCLLSFSACENPMVKYLEALKHPAARIAISAGGDSMPADTTYDFGPCFADPAGTNTTSAVVFSIQNNGNLALTIAGISVTGADQTCFPTTSPLSTQIEPSATTTFTVRFAPLAKGTKTAVLTIDSNAEGADPLVLTLRGTGIWVERTKLLAADGIDRDLFGVAVAISGDNAIVGAPGNADHGAYSGSAYIYHWSGTGWVQQAELEPSDLQAGDEFGGSVAIAGDYAAVGAPGFDLDVLTAANSGCVYFYHWDGSSWIQVEKKYPADGAKLDEYGSSVSMSLPSGDYPWVIVGVPNDDDKGEDSGSAYIYHWNGGIWAPETPKLLASDGAAFDHFGASVCIDDEKAIVGAYGDGGEKGSAYIFTVPSEEWEEQQKLTASDGTAGDWYGLAVGISSSGAVVGSPYDDDNGSDSGSAYVYGTDGETWMENTKLAASDGAANDSFGMSLSILGDSIVIGARTKASGAGSAYSFLYDGESWKEETLVASDSAVGDLFGCSTGMSGTRIIVGAYLDDDKGSMSGSAYIYQR